MLEQHNPDLQFDWTRILKSPQQEQGSGEDRREHHTDRQRSSQPVAPPPPAARPAESIGDEPEPIAEATETAEVTEAATATEAPDHAEATLATEAALGTDAAHIEPAGTSPARTESAPIEPLEPLEPPEPPEPSIFDLAPRYTRIGAEGLARLRARYAEVMARISERPLDESAREQLRTKAERLNPDGWVTAEDVTDALEQYETVFEELRSVVGRPVRRRRRRRV